MKRIKKFDSFLNEDKGWGASFLGAWDDFNREAAKVIPSADKVTKVDNTASVPSSTTPAVNTTKADLSAITAIPGNDDFLLYMQHQQGLAGAKGLISAAAGVGNIHPQTLKTKVCSHLGGSVPYANLQCNIPVDKPQYKKDLVAALNKKDEKTAANIFLKMWKEKWVKKYTEAKALINKPENAAVKAAIEKYSKQYGVPFDFAITVALIESGFNPKSGNSSYKGLYALSQQEFNKYVSKGNILSIDDNTKAGIQCLKNNIKEFTKYLGPLLAKVNVGKWATSLA